MARVDVGSFGIPGNFAMPFYNPANQSYDLPGVRKYLRGRIPKDRWSFTDDQIDLLISGEGLPGPLDMYDLQAGQGGSSGAAPPPLQPAGKVATDSFLPGSGTEEDPLVFPDTTVTASGPVTVGAYQQPDAQGRIPLSQLDELDQSLALSGSKVNINGTFYWLGEDGNLYANGVFPGSMRSYGGTTVTDLTGRGSEIDAVPLPGSAQPSTDTGILDIGLGDSDLGSIEVPLPSPELQSEEADRIPRTVVEPSAYAGIESYIYDPGARLPDGGYTPLDWDSVEQRRNPGGLKLPDGRVEGDNMSGPLQLDYAPPSHLKALRIHQNDFEQTANVRLRGSEEFVPGGKTYFPLEWRGGATGLEDQEAGAGLTVTFTPEEQLALLGSQGWVLKEQASSEIYNPEAISGIDVEDYTEAELLEMGYLHSPREWYLYVMTKNGRVVKLPWFDGKPRPSLLSWEKKVFNKVRTDRGEAADLNHDLIDAEKLRDDVYEFLETLGIGSEGSGIELPSSTKLNLEGAEYGPSGGKWEDFYELRDGRTGWESLPFDVVEDPPGTFKIRWKQQSPGYTSEDENKDSHPGPVKRRAKMVGDGFESGERSGGFFLSKKVAI